MPSLNVIISLFVMMALFGTGRRRFEIVLSIAAFAVVAVSFGVSGGPGGFAFSLAGVGAALVLTIPLAIMGVVSGADLVVSVALGGMLGAVQYTLVFCIATALLAVQRIVGVRSGLAGEAAAGSAPAAVDLAGLGEPSVLVEIEASRILRADRTADAARASGDDAVADAERGGLPAARALPWCAKLAVATLAILMLGSSV